MASRFENLYLSLVDQVIELGQHVPSRAGATRSVFGASLTIHETAEGFFPILTTRKIFYKPILGELAAFLRGATDLETFKKFGCNYWDANAGRWWFNRDRPQEDWSVGRIYGAQWREWDNREGTPIDQLKQLIEGLKKDPHGRRHIVTAWNPGELGQMCLPPCHIFFQCYVKDGLMRMLVYMRSVDLCIGLPADVVLYSVLQALIARAAGLQPGELAFVLGDTHVYENHVARFTEQQEREIFDLPTYTLAEEATLDNFEPSHFTLHNYQHGEPLQYAFNV